jgi:hypothetical protein
MKSHLFILSIVCFLEETYNRQYKKVKENLFHRGSILNTSWNTIKVNSLFNVTINYCNKYNNNKCNYKERSLWYKNVKKRFIFKINSYIFLVSKKVR